MPSKTVTQRLISFKLKCGIFRKNIKTHFIKKIKSLSKKTCYLMSLLFEKYPNFILFIARKQRQTETVH